MKIERVDVIAFDAGSGDAAGNPWRPVGCRIYTDDGRYGDGEIALAYGMGAAAAEGVLHEYAPWILGSNALDHEAIWNRLYRTSFWGQNGGPISIGGISAIDVALWDLKGKRYQEPVHQLLGGKIRDELRCYASQIQFGWGTEGRAATRPEHYFDATRAAVAEGYDAVKVDLLFFDEDGEQLVNGAQTQRLDPRTVRMVRDRAAAVREALGDDGDIIMECHSLTDAQSAIQLGNAVKEFGILAIEEPTTPTPKMHRKIKRELGIPIASGERIYTRWQFMPYFEDGTIDLAQPDLGTCGGITEAKKIADIAYVYDIGFQAHICASPLLVAASAQVEAVAQAFQIHEHHVAYRFKYNTDLCVINNEPVSGRLKVPDGVGIGNEFSPDAISRARVTTFTV